MKKFPLRCAHLVLAAIAALVPPAVHAQTSDQAPAGSPQIVFENLEHDFGTTQPNKRLVHNFVFTNQGSETLIIEKVKAG